MSPALSRATKVLGCTRDRSDWKECALPADSPTWRRTRRRGMEEVDRIAARMATCRTGIEILERGSAGWVLWLSKANHVIQAITANWFQLRLSASCEGTMMMCGAACQPVSDYSKDFDHLCCALSDDINGATWSRAKVVRTHLFHRICKLARPMETPLCRMCFLFLHQHKFFYFCVTSIYSK